MKFNFLVVGALVLSAGPTRAADPIALRVSPSIAIAPANLVVSTTIEADPDNRVIEVVAESENLYRSSEIRLDGVHSPRVTEVQFRSLPGGMYNVRVVLRGANGKERGYAQADVNVIDNGNR